MTRSPSGAAGPLPTRSVLGLAAWWTVAGAQAVRVWGHGPNGRAGALVLLLLAAAAVVACVADGLRRAVRVVVVVVLALVGVGVLTPLLGRAPWMLVLGALPAAIVALGLRPDRTSAVSWSQTAVSGSTVLVLIVGWWVWVATGSLVAEAVLLGLALSAAVGALVGWQPLAAADRVVARAARPFWSPVRRTALAVGKWWRRPTTAGSRWAGAAGALISAPVFWRLTTSEALVVRGTNDFEAHVRRALALDLSPLFVSVPHPVWHLTFLLVRFLVGNALAIVVIGAVATGVLVGLLASLGRSEWDERPAMSGRVAALFGLGYLVVENAAQLVPRGGAWWQRLDVVGLRARGSSFYPLHQWGSPTITMSLPLVLLMVLLVLFTLRDDLDRARRHRPALLVSTVVATMTLPAATLALVPAVVLYVLVARRPTWERLRVLVPWFLLPGALCCVAQTVFLASGVSSFERTTWRWNPGWLFPYVGLDRPVFWLVLLVVPVGWWLCGRRFVTDPAVALSLTMLAIALFPALLLQQTASDKVNDGDLAMPALFAGILLTVFALRLVVAELEQRWRERRRTPLSPAAVAAALLVVLMVCAGTLDLMSAAGVVPEL